jgi:uncharacterized Tic20 family protein
VLRVFQLLLREETIMTDVGATISQTLPADRPRGHDKIWIVLSHLSTFLGFGFILLPLVVYLAMKNESAYVADNSREVLNFHLSVLIYGLCCIPLMALFGLGFLLLGGLALLTLICSIVGAIKAAEDGCYHYPFSLRLVK